MSAHFKRVVRLIESGHITFVLGSAIHHPTKLMAKEFYQKLAYVFECEALGEDRFAVAQHIADRYGREELYAEIRKVFAETKLEPRSTHNLFAAWHSFRTSSGGPLPYPTVITTNYDDLLEQILDRAGLPYHLLSYQSGGPHRGRFFHRSPDGELRIIERPRNVRELSDGFVVVKLNGGRDSHHHPIPEQYSTTRLDYWDLAARIPQVLPAAVQSTVSRSALLILGHGLAVPDIESLIRFANKNRSGARSWAVVLGHKGAEYWHECGVRILSKDVNEYAETLHSCLHSLSNQR